MAMRLKITDLKSEGIINHHFYLECNPWNFYLFRDDMTPMLVLGLQFDRVPSDPNTSANSNSYRHITYSKMSMYSNPYNPWYIYLTIKDALSHTTVPQWNRSRRQRVQHAKSLLERCHRILDLLGHPRQERRQTLFTPCMPWSSGYDCVGYSSGGGPDGGEERATVKQNNNPSQRIIY